MHTFPFHSITTNIAIPKEQEKRPDDPVSHTSSLNAVRRREVSKPEVLNMTDHYSMVLRVTGDALGIASEYDRMILLQLT